MTTLMNKCGTIKETKMPKNKSKTALIKIQNKIGKKAGLSAWRREQQLEKLNAGETNQKS